MKKITRIFVGALGIGLLAAGLSFLTSRPVPAQGRLLPVRVVNTTAAPVPTAAQGTTRIAGSVAITGTPSVNANITNPVSLASGSISNTASTPLFTKDVDAAGRYPFTLTAFNIGPDVNNATNNGAQVVLPATLTPGGPPAQTAVIEFLSAICEVPTGITLDHINLQTHLGTNVNAFFLTTPGHDVLSAPFGGEIWTSQQIKIYASANSVVFAGLPGNNNGCVLSISGYMLP